MASPKSFPGAKSPFRSGFLKVELFLGGVWTNVFDDLGEDGVSITRGRSDEGSQPAPARMTLTLDNTGGKYSPRNPASPYYGLIGRNTPVRVSTQPTAGGTTFFRFWGEVTEWPQRWTTKGTAYAPIECSGVMRRLNQGSSPLRSPLYRALSQLGSDLVAYWPMEDGTESKQFAVAVGRRPMSVVGSPAPAAYSGFAASEPIPTLQDGYLNAAVPSYVPASPAVAQVRWLMQIPAGTPNNAVLVRVKCSGTLGYAELRYESANSFGIEGFDDSGASVGAASGWLAGGATNLKQRLSLEMTQSGANISVTLIRYEVGQPTGVFITGSFAGVTLGRVTSVEFNPTRAALGDVAAGHLTVEKAITPLAAVSIAVLAGYAGERAHDRIVRLSTENGFTTSVTSSSSADVSTLGPQGVNDLMSLLREAATTDGGVLFERRTSENLGYRTLEAMWSSTPTAVVPYTDNLLLPFEPVDDDQATRNKVTVTRAAGGSSVTVEQVDGPLGTAAVGIYDEEVTLSLNSDRAAQDQADWRLHVGTADEARWPVIGLDLAHPTFLANTALRDDVLSVDVGHTVKVTNLPDWLPPFDVLALVQGYSETIQPHSWQLEWNTTPAGPLRVGHWDAAGDRWSGDGTTTPALNATQTTFTAVVPAGVKWTSADGSYGIVVNGELMTVTNVNAAGTGFTVTRSVNGVVKSHPAGSAVALADPVYYGR